MKTVLGIVGGSGLYDLPGLTEVEWRSIDSPWGTPSDAILFAEYESLPVCFLPRHGRSHRLSPGAINYRANIDAASRPRRPRPGPPMRVPPTGAPAPQRAETRKTHSSPPVARGFLLWRISYAKRRPISFTKVRCSAALSCARERDVRSDFVFG